jgi:phospholipase/carboxylesterase
MPRTQRSAELKFSVPPSFDRPIQVESASFSASSLDFPHVVFAPLHYESGYSYPLILWLHGRGSDERQLPRVMPLVSMRNYVAVAPRGIRTTSPDEPGNPGKPGRECYEWLQTEEHIQQAEQRVFDSIELATRTYNIASRRIFLVGFDSGGTMALRLAMSHPSQFAGVISLCGALPTGRTLFSNLVAARRLGMFLATGRTSRDYAATQVCEDLRLLHTAGLSVTLRQYPCGHELQPQMLSDVDRWIIEQINPSATSSEQSDAEWSHETE